MESGWTSTFASDPDDDFRLTLEIEHDGEVVAVLKKVDDEIKLISYKEIEIPSDWLDELKEHAEAQIE